MTEVRDYKARQSDVEFEEEGRVSGWINLPQKVKEKKERVAEAKKVHQIHLAPVPGHVRGPLHFETKEE